MHAAVRTLLLLLLLLLPVQHAVLLLRELYLVLTTGAHPGSAHNETGGSNLSAPQ